MVMKSFNFTRTPQIYFGPGTVKELPGLVSEKGSRALLITGLGSLKKSGKLELIENSFKKNGINVFHFNVNSEPSPEMIDKAVLEYKHKSIEAVISIGGGSVIDAGKAVSAMLPVGGCVKDYLEGVGTKKHSGAKIYFIAVPTTAGTGAEATKNAVLSSIGKDGFKKSLRHDNFVPDRAVIDPELALNCPAKVRASCGMDAFSQLLESYVSPRASPVTDALALSGLRYIKENLVLACDYSSCSVDVMAGMAYASLVSGITLSNAGLGIIHSLSGIIGGYFNIPHGVICGSLLGPGTRINIQKLEENKDIASLKKHAEIGFMFSGKHPGDIEEGCCLLVNKIEELTKALDIPYLSDYGIRLADIDEIIDKAENRNNPVELDKNDIREILVSRIKK
ncbi:MAG: iron-containing alcohol dehydrogenase [Elusimicrobia bacterium]|nr:iron-containing alcohol dehydrogenase [Candidatus Liberimonas magnetica]